MRLSYYKIIYISRKIVEIILLVLYYLIYLIMLSILYYLYLLLYIFQSLFPAISKQYPILFLYIFLLFVLCSFPLYYFCSIGSRPNQAFSLCRVKTQSILSKTS